ncbi:hypothetical protein [Nostoc sp. NOS(2021)]|nr:hypothetical protein [Nostoc sp. NOS(2021)]
MNKIDIEYSWITSFGKLFARVEELEQFQREHQSWHEHHRDRGQ